MKRKYCSREFKKLHWSDATSATAQRRRIMCKLGCGEEACLCCRWWSFAEIVPRVFVKV